jgi:hypothetical protein
MKNAIRKRVLAAIIVAVSATAVGAQSAPAVAVFKRATCGCCAKWVDHVRASGFAPTATDVDDLNAVKSKHNVPQALHSCHTALVGGYVIEGHVPAADIKRLLKERPAIVGLAVPGMPAGSPGMEGPPPQKYDVLAFDKQGKTRVYATHGN